MGGGGYLFHMTTAERIKEVSRKVLATGGAIGGAVFTPSNWLLVGSAATAVAMFCGENSIFANTDGKAGDKFYQQAAITQPNKADEPADKTAALLGQVARLDTKQQETLMRGITNFVDEKASGALGNVASVSLKGAFGATAGRLGNIAGIANLR